MKVYERENRKKRSGKIRRNLVIALILVAFLAAAWYVTGNFVKVKGFSGTADFLNTIVSNYRRSFSAEPEKIYLKIKSAEYERLSKERLIALKRGVIINEPDNFVPATLTYDGNEMKVKIRLKGHMTDHIEGDQWSFRIRVEDKGSVMGMKLFSIQHPGTRGYVHEWVYHQLMRQEGIIALRYKFIEVYINGKSNGIYALEENFDKELPENNGRPNGPLVRFNPDLYWVNRYNEMLKEKPVEEFSSFQSARLEAYRETRFLSDSSNKSNFLKAMALMDGFREGIYRVPDVFDIQKLARFHAVIDLMGGYHSLDWSDVKYYFNPVTLKFEPIAYESFAIFPTSTISGLYRFRNLQPGKDVEDLHVALFSDRTFFTEYTKALQKISDPEYLDKFFAENEKQLNENLAIVGRDYPFKKFDRSDYYRNQKIIRKILDAPQGVNAYYQGDSAEYSVFRFGNLEALPYEIVGIMSDSVVSSDSSLILPSKQINTAVKYYRYRILSSLLKNKNSLSVLYRIPGMSAIKETPVLPFPKPDNTIISEAVSSPKEGNIEKFDFIQKVGKNKIYFRPGDHTIAEPLIIPTGYSVYVNAGVNLIISAKGSIRSYSPMYLLGSEERMVSVDCNNEAGSAISLIDTDKASVFNKVKFTSTNKKLVTGKAGVAYSYSSDLTVISCVFDSTMFEDAITMYDGKLNVSRSEFRNIPNDAIDLNNAYASVVSTSFRSVKENSIDMMASTVSVYQLFVSGNKGKAINVKQASQLFATKVNVERSGVGVSFENSSRGNIESLNVSSARAGIVVFENNKGSGYPNVSVRNFTGAELKNKMLVQKGAVVFVDGSRVDTFEENVKKKADVK